MVSHPANGCKICLVCSSGGHFFELKELSEFWSSLPRFWITFRHEDTVTSLRDENVVCAFHPTNRNVVNLFRNFILAMKTLRRERPEMILSTGAGVSVPFIYAGRILGIHTVYLESLTRVDRLSLSARLVYPAVDQLLVQWPELTERYPKAEFWGQIL